MLFVTFLRVWSVFKGIDAIWVDHLVSPLIYQWTQLQGNLFSVRLLFVEPVKEACQRSTVPKLNHLRELCSQQLNPKVGDWLRESNLMITTSDTALPRSL